MAGYNNTSPKCFASNNTWHLGANVCQRNFIVKGIGFFPEVRSALQARPLGTWGLMHFAIFPTKGKPDMLLMASASS